MRFNILDQDILNIKGIGKQTAQELNEINIFKVRDLLNYFPYRYEDYRVKNLAEVNHGDKVTVEGKIYSEPYVKKLPQKRNIISIKVAVDDYIVTASWFNRLFLKNQFQLGRHILLTGKIDKNRMQLTVSESQFLDSTTVSKKGSLVPVYSLPSVIKQNNFRKIIINTLRQFYATLEDYLPDEIIEKYKLYSYREAIKAIHLPKNLQDGKQARRRLVYDELLFYQFKIQLFKKINRKKLSGIKRNIDINKIEFLIAALPFKLTNAQQRVSKEIIDDLNSEAAMNRLLQGDVGSGKTVVAAIALYANYLSGYQGALMAPTEILAEQHAESLFSILSPLGIEMALLTGNLSEGKRKNILSQLQMGLIDIVVGTHALIQNDVNFRQLGLVITDEQHRFGVEQRAVLRNKGEDKTPDVLFMTATPIPRTLAISAFGDMDVSTIDEYPVGRKPVKTYWIRPKQFDRVLAFIDQQIKLGRQAYIICPLIEESEKLDVQNAIDVHSVLTEHFPDYKIGLMHGRLSSKEKDEVMANFTGNKINVLVSTTVVEVGVNIPNATLMIVYDAERFGLAQLHQLRGRVGRGNEQSYCILIADPKTEIGKERMMVMTETNDGFEIARRDLELRGPGDFFGVKQSGLPDFKLADIIEDYRTLEVTRADAWEWVNSEEFWQDSKWKKLIKEMKRQGLLQEYSLDS